MNTAVPFTQFMRPSGRPANVIIDRPVEIAEKAQALIAKGYELQIEVLTTSQIHMTVSDTREEEDLYVELCSNGPEVLPTVDKLITDAYTGLIANG